MNWLNSIKARWTLFGILFGSLFPIAGTLLQIYYINAPFSWKSVLLVQTGESVLWIVDLAPLVLGTIFYFVGMRDHDLQRTNQQLNIANQALSELHTNLEQLVEQRTQELAITSAQAIKRADLLSAVTELSRSLVTFTDLEALLEGTTRLISQQLGYYHTGIFLLDEDRQFAVLRAANSAGGKKMLERGYHLRVVQANIVGFVISTGNPHIALDIEAEAVYFSNPDLPDTRSEMILPLKSGNQIIGALDVQSTQPNAFSQEEMNILSTFADQVGTAMENVRLHEETRKALSNAEAAYRQLTGETWANIRRQTPVVGYRFDGTKAEPLVKPQEARQNVNGQEALFVPLELRGESIGSLCIKPKSNDHHWTEDELAIIEATADRVALAAENARLIAESQKRASKEQVIGEVSSKISAAINLDNILQTALREMGRILPGAEIRIQVENE